jgi:hypothetical protein
MIKNCKYSDTEFEIQFEWTLPPETAKSSPNLRAFMETVLAVPGTRLIESEEGISGLVFSYDGWAELTGRYRADSRRIQLDQEFSRFFGRVRPDSKASR